MAAAFVQSVGICHCAAVRNMTSLTSFCQSCRCSDCVSKQSALLCCLHLFAWSSHIITILLPSLSSSITVISYQLSFAAFGFGLRSVCGACMKARWVDMKTWLKKPLICGNYSYSCFLDYPTLKGIIMLIKKVLHQNYVDLLYCLLLICHVSSSNEHQSDCCRLFRSKMPHCTSTEDLVSAQPRNHKK